MSNPLLFSRGPFSNFYTAPIVMGLPWDVTKEMEFPDNETYFQSAKVWFKAAIMGRGFHIEEYMAIAEAGSPAAAKRLARPPHFTMPLSVRKLWDAYYAPVIMLECNLAKYQQHENLRKRLLRTGNRPLVEHRPDPVWGDNMDGTGKNLMGKTLELVRSAVA